MTADTLRGFDDPESTPRGSGIARIETVWRRRKWLGILVFILPLTAAVAMIVALPDLYESSALVMVERQQVPEAFVRPTVTSELETRIHSISQEILSRSRLESLVTRMGLYPELKDRAPADEAVNRLRRDVRLELNRADQSRGATTAFTISYRGADPQTVAVVTNTLRITDLSGRIGGEEFAALLPCSLEEGVIVKGVEIRTFADHRPAEAARDEAELIEQASGYQQNLAFPGYSSVMITLEAA